jgi:hypothetical protein
VFSDDKFDVIVYTRYMPVKTKKTKPHVHTAQAAVSTSLEDAPEKEERRPAVTQVVEVVEETPEPSAVAGTPPVAPVDTKPIESPPVPVSSLSEAPPVTESPTIDQFAPSVPPGNQEEKRKELVDELFQNKQQASSPVMPEISIHTEKSSKPVYLWAIVVIVACLVAGGSLLFLSGKNNPFVSKGPVPTPTPIIVSTVTPTASPSAVKRSDITIQVLNGGGKAGAASKMKATLEEKGYTVGETGNTEKYTYDKTVILVQAAKKQYLSLLENDLKGTYVLGTSAATLESTVSFDARVIVGKE